MRKRLKINWLIFVIGIVINLLISCRLPIVHITFKNQTEHNVCLYVDTLYLMTMKPNSVERGDLVHYLPSALYIKSPSIGRVYIGSAFHFDSIVGADTFYNYYKFKGQIDDSVISEYNLPLLTLFEKRDTVFLFTEK